MTGPARTLEVACRRRGLRLDRAAVAAVVGILDAHAGAFRGGCPAGELSLAFVGDRELARLHEVFLADPSPTDVITFSGDPALGVAGEICVSADAARRQAGRGAGAFTRELMLYVVHGWLHLAGYDDLRPEAKRRMRRAEARAMRLIEPTLAAARFKLA